MLLATLLLAQGLTADLDSILASPKLQGAGIGVLITERDGTVLYQRNPGQRLLPASNEKLFTCAFALKRLGPTYRPKTLFWKEKNALVIRSTGDPTESYQTWLNLGRKLNPKRKPVFISEAYRAGYPEGWQLGDLPNRYAAPVYALTVDRGSLELWAKNGKPELRPTRFDLALNWNPRTGPVKDTLDVFHHKLNLRGELPKEETRIDTLGLPDTDYQVGSLLGKRVAFTSSTPKRNPDYVLTGDPLPQTMQTCLQMSDNNLAENFLLMAASKGSDLPKPYDQAIPQLQAFLKGEMGLTQDDVNPADGCGMSRHNIVTPRAINTLLRWSLNQPTAELWRSMLDHPGSGTLKSRLKEIPFQGKTGTLEHVSALSGYLTVSGRTVIVSIMFNNFAGPTSDAKELENMLVIKLFANLSAGTKRA